MHLTLTRQDEAAVAALAASLAQAAQPGDCIALYGDLGAGKTHFARHFIRTLCGGETEVASPTFLISQSYPCLRGTLWHYDLYRVEHPGDVEETGLPETLTHGITLIEWPQVAAAWLPENTLHIVFAFHESCDYRDIALTGNILWMKHLPPSSSP